MRRAKRRPHAPVVSTTSFSDYFTGANGSAWDSTKWTMNFGNGSSTATVSNGSGVMSPTAAPNTYVWAVAKNLSIADAVVTGRFKHSTDTESLRSYVGLRVQANGDKYFLQSATSAGYFEMYRQVGGVAALLGTFPWTRTTVQQRFRFEIWGSTIRGKVWADGTTEPVEWGVSATDTTITAAGSLELGTTNGNVSTTNTTTWGEIALVASTGSGRTDVGPSGEAMPIGNLAAPNGTWELIFSDDFTTDVALGSWPSAVSTKWEPYPYPWDDTSNNGIYWPEKVVTQSGGMLQKYIHTENGQHLVAAIQPKIAGASGNLHRLYGRYAIRWRSESLPRYKVAWLLWPESGVWPRDGEIDFPEMGLDSSNMYGFVHYQGGTSGSDQAVVGPIAANIQNWHTDIIEWSPGMVRFIHDGTIVGTVTSRIPNTPMRWVIQTETTLDGTVPLDATAGRVYIDWVVVWKYTAA